MSSFMWVTYPAEKITLKAHLARPKGSGPWPAVLVIQEIFGVNAHVRETADRLAEAGYVALAPAIFQRTAPDLELGYGPEDITKGRSHKDKTTAPQLLSDLRASLAYLKSLPEVKKERFGVIGFCFGGHVAFLAATLPEVAVTASFYGGGLATMTPGGGPPTITRAGEIHGRIALFFGDRDPILPPEQVEAIGAALQGVGVRHSIHRYPVGHGFFCNHRKDYDGEAAKDAWKKTLELFSSLN